MSNPISLSSDTLITTISNIPEIRDLQIEHLTFELDWRKAKALFASGFYKKMTSIEQIHAILQEGRSLGLSSSEAMQGLYSVHGNIQMYGSAKTSYLTKRGYKIQYIEEVIENNQLIATTAVITKDEEKYISSITIDQIKDKKASNGFKNAPMTKLRYEAINRIIKTQIAGIVPEIVGRSEDDIIDIVPTQELKKVSVEESLLNFVSNECPTLEALNKVKSQCTTDELKKAYNLRAKELEPVIETQVLVVEEIEDYGDLIADINSASWEELKKLKRLCVNDTLISYYDTRLETLEAKQEWDNLGN